MKTRSGGQITYNATTGLFQTPQGVVTLEQIHQARQLLNSIAGMFGPGCYFSDCSTKSLRYSIGRWGHGGDTRRVFMFLVDVAMGKPYYPDRDIRRIPSGYDSIFAQGGKVHSSMTGGHSSKQRDDCTKRLAM